MSTGKLNEADVVAFLRDVARREREFIASRFGEITNGREDLVELVELHIGADAIDEVANRIGEGDFDEWFAEVEP